MSSSGLIGGIRRGWALVDAHDRRRLRFVAVYGVLIAVLDTFALVLIYALINLLGNQHVGGVSERLIRVLGVSQEDRYRAALILLVITSALFVTRSLLSVFGLWLTLGAANGAQANILS